MVQRKRSPEPANQSRAAGQAAPASAAATPPRGEPGHEAAARAAQGFYSPEDEGAPPPAEAPSPLAAFVQTVRETAIPQGEDETLDESVARATLAPEIADPDDLEAEIRRIREIRKPLGAYQLKLALPKRHGYHRHWFNDVAGRIDDAVSNGWTFVRGKDGENLSRVVGAGRDGGALRAYAMEIPLVFWQEDMDARHAAAAEKVAALKASPFRAQPGTSKPADRGKFYDPQESDAGPISVVKG